MSSKLYIGNLPFTVTEEQLSTHLADAGEVVSVKIIKDKFTGDSRGFGFVEMTSENSAQDAISKFDGTELGGRNIKISVAKESSGSSGGRRPFGSGGSNTRRH